MSSSAISASALFKGIALFTPGGDLVYCIDPKKQNRWHLQLCATLQELLGLAEPPHFLATCYAATIDRWQDPHTGIIHTLAEASPRVLHHQVLLNAVFGIDNLEWLPTSLSMDLCDPALLDRYQIQFPELWVSHDLIVRAEEIGLGDRSVLRSGQPTPTHAPADLTWAPDAQAEPSQGYVFRLFVAGQSAATEKILQSLHHLLEQALQQPYTLKVIDIYKNPEQAEANHVTAIPTLVKAWPPPTKRIVGNLESAQQLINFLNVPVVSREF
ncbi:MAG: circadian clock KaiB family protein [Synechococcales bacterium]|nr:circadian clock KaiB family protein [Synechococcales bacterium]